MAESKWRQDLAALSSAALQQIAGIERDLQEQRAEHEQLLGRMRELQQQLAFSNEYGTLLEVELQRSKAAWARSEFEMAMASLAESWQTVAAASSHIAQRQELLRQRQELLDSDPSLEQAMQQYRAFESGAEQVLSLLPEFHRQAAVAEQEKLRLRLADYLALEEACEVSYGDEVVLRLVLVQFPESAQFAWATSILRSMSDDEPADSPDSFVGMVIAALRRLIFEPEWRLTQLDQLPFAGYLAFLVSGEYVGQDAPDRSLEAFLCKQLEDVAAGLRFSLRIEVAEMSAHAWSLGSVAADPADLVTAALGDSAGGEDNAGVSPAGASLVLRDSWYSSADLASWERPLKVVEGSQWNENARRLRTVLMRMVAEGFVDGNMVPRSKLGQGLPEPHRSCIEESVSLMVDAGLLNAADAADREQGGAVSINPDELDQVEALINRDVNEFWSEIIT